MILLICSLVRGFGLDTCSRGGRGSVADADDEEEADTLEGKGCCSAGGGFGPDPTVRVPRGGSALPFFPPFHNREESESSAALLGGDCVDVIL